MPKMWFQPAGLRRLPMKSEPSATGSMRWAKATAAPPLEPPALTAVSQALGGGTEQVVEGVRTQAQFGHVGFADDDAASRLHASGHDAVGARHLLFQHTAAHGARKAQCMTGVLDRLRDAVQPAARLASAQLLVALARLGQQGLVSGAVDDGIAGRIEALDALQVSLHHIDAGDLAGMNGVGEFAGRQGRDVSAHGGQKRVQSVGSDRDMKPGGHRPRVCHRRVSRRAVRNVRYALP